MSRTLDSGTLTLPASSTGAATVIVTAVTDPAPVEFRARPRSLADPALFIPNHIPFGVAAQERVVQSTAIFARSSEGITAAEQVDAVVPDDAETTVRTSSAAPTAPTQAWVVTAVHGGHPEDITLDWELLGPTHGTLAVALAGLAGGGGGTVLR